MALFYPHYSHVWMKFSKSGTKLLANEMNLLVKTLGAGTEHRKPNWGTSLYIGAYIYLYNIHIYIVYVLHVM